MCDIYGQDQMHFRTVYRGMAKDAARPGRPATTTTKRNILKIRDLLKKMSDLPCDS